MISRTPMNRVMIVAVLCLLPAGAGCAASLPAPERAGQVIIIRDTYGIPHIRGKTDADVAFGLAYAHAEDDFRTTEESLIAARGRSAEVQGPDGAVLDYLVRLLKVREFVDEKYETDLSPQVRAICEAYAEGLNYYARLHPGVADQRFLPYTGKDVVAGFVQKTPFFFGLQGALRSMQKGTTKKKEAREKGQACLGSAETIPIGSNTFAVGPQRSADGLTRLDINSHQPWEGPVAWYEAHLQSDEGLNVIGGLFPGTPMILHGHNQNLGWAFTVNKPDLIDIYRLEINPDDPHQYKLDGQWKDFERGEARFKVKLIGGLMLPVKRETLYSVHGPVMRFDHGTYAIRMAGWGEIRMPEQYYRMSKARNFDEWIAAMRQRWIPSLNACYADKDGNIYYLYNGLIPKRKEGVDWKGILPGDRSDLIWTEYVPFESLPQVKNPASGFVQNANSTPFEASGGKDNPRPEDFPPSYGIQTDQTDRSRRILELLKADDSITHDEFLKYKWDQTVPTDGEVWARFKPLLEGTPPEDLKEAAAIIRRWDRAFRADSHDAALAQMFNYQYEAAKYLGAPKPEPWEALRIAVAHLKKHFGTIDIPLGELQRLRRGTVDLPIGGGPHVFNCVHSKQDEKDGRLVGLAGDSYVLIVAFDKNGVASSQAIHQYGNVNLPNSPHYADQAPLFIQRKMRTSWLSDSEILSNMERAYHPGEEGR